VGQLKSKLIEGIFISRNMSERKDNNKYQFKYNLANDYALGEEALITALAQKTRVFYLAIKIKTNELNLSFALENLMND